MAVINLILERVEDGEVSDTIEIQTDFLDAMLKQKEEDRKEIEAEIFKQILGLYERLKKK